VRKCLSEHSIRSSSSSTRPPAPPIRGLVVPPPRDRFVPTSTLPSSSSSSSSSFSYPAFNARERRDVALEEWRVPCSAKSPRDGFGGIFGACAECRSFSLTRARANELCQWLLSEIFRCIMTYLSPLISRRIPRIYLTFFLVSFVRTRPDTPRNMASARLVTPGSLSLSSSLSSWSSSMTSLCTIS